MNLSTILSIAGAIIVSVGGAGVIICTVVKFCADMIANRLEARYEQRLSKELEAYKSNLESKTYISNARFDAEFSLYRDLSKAFLLMIKQVNLIIPPGIYYSPSDPDERRELDLNHYEKASEAVVNAQDILFENAVFIPQEIYDCYEELLQIGKNQLYIFEDSLRYADKTGPGSEEFRVQPKDHQQSRDLNRKFHELNTQIRKYLSTLSVR